MIEENSENVSYINNNFINKFIRKNKLKKLNITLKKIKNEEIYIIDVENLINDNFLSNKIFKDYNKEKEIYKVNKSGLKSDPEFEEKGSERFCTNSENLANWLNKIIKESNGFPKFNNKNSKLLKYKKVSSYFRFMRYQKGGIHFPHYDSDYKFKYSKKITSYSLVMYLSNCDSGEICFINDKTEYAKNRSDWGRMNNENEIKIKIKPKIGRIVIFSHDICHSVNLFEGDERVIIRGDLIFKELKNEK